MAGAAAHHDLTTRVSAPCHDKLAQHLHRSMEVCARTSGDPVLQQNTQGWQLHVCLQAGMLQPTHLPGSAGGLPISRKALSQPPLLPKLPYIYSSTSILGAASLAHQPRTLLGTTLARCAVAGATARHVVMTRVSASKGGQLVRHIHSQLNPRGSCCIEFVRASAAPGCKGGVAACMCACRPATCSLGACIRARGYLPCVPAPARGSCRRLPACI